MTRVVFFLFFLTANACLAQQITDNAALKYLRADISLRQAYPLALDAATKLEKSLELPLDGEAEKLVTAADDALVEFHHGATLKRCNWAISVEDGLSANTAHRGAIKELVAVAGLRSRLRFRDGDWEGAKNDVLAAITAARHLSLDGTLASVLFAYRLEREITGTLAQNLQRLPPAQLKELSTGLDDLPTGSSLGNALVSEKVSRNDLLRIIEGVRNRDELIERLLKGVPALGSNKALAAEIVDGCGGSVKGFVNCVEQQQSNYRSWSSRFTLPPVEFEKAYKAEADGLSKSNPVVREFTPALWRFRWADAYSQTRRALLQAAIAVQLDGQSALSRILDPYDARAFAYIPIDGGFRLESRLSENGTSLSISIVPGNEDRNAREK